LKQGNSGRNSKFVVNEKRGLQKFWRMEIRKFCGKRSNRGSFPRDPKKFSEIGGNVKQGEMQGTNASGEQLCRACSFNVLECMGGDLGGTGGTVDPKFEVGGRPMYPPPNILRSAVIGCDEKYELTRKGVKEEVFVLKSRFLVKILKILVKKRVI